MIRLWTGVLMGIGTSECYARTVSTESAPLNGEWLRMSGSLLLVLLLITALAWVLRRVQGKGFTLDRNIRILSGMRLGNRERLLLVEVAGRFLLLGVTPGQVSLICDFGNAPPDNLDTVKKPSFSELLRASIGKKE